MTTLTRPRAGTGNGGVPARRAVFRWGWRLFRREWRQQLLVLGLLTVAVAATIWGASVVTNTQLPNPDYATFGTAAAQVTLPGTDPHLAADIAAIAGRWGPADLIENQDIATGTTQPVQLRAENPHGHYNAPLLGLVSGTYPAGPGQVALTSQVASLYGAHVGGTWQAAGTTWRVTGIVQDPSNLADEFALAAPGQVPHPSQVTMLLGSSPAVQQAISNGNGTLPGMPAAATFTFPSAFMSGLPSATVVLVVEVLGLVFIGLVSVAGFSVMAQRRLRALGMLSAIGATERNLRLVMIADGLAVGVAAALAGAVLGFAAWFAYVPTLQQATGHVVDAANLPWWAFAIGVVFAIATSVLASRRPAKTMAQVPVVAALSGRPAPPKAGAPLRPARRHRVRGRRRVPGVHRRPGRGGGPRARRPTARAAPAGRPGRHDRRHRPARPAGHQRAGRRAGPRLPVAIRIALRDLVRYRARSGAALAATTFAVFLAMGICLVASTKFDNPLNWTGPNLSGSQLIVYTQQSQGGGTIGAAQQRPGSPPGRAGEQPRRQPARAVACHWNPQAHAVPGGHAGKQPVQFHRHRVRGHPAVARHLRDQGQPDRSRHRHPHHAARAGGPAAHGDDLEHQVPVPGEGVPGSSGSPPCTLSNDCLANPVIQTVSSLPGGTSAPNTVITEYAVSKYHLQPSLNGWLIQAPAPLTATQINAARQLALAYGVTAETKSSTPGLGEFAGGATALGIVIAFGVLAASVGLIRSETARDLRTLTATGASTATRRMITAATAAALGLLGAILGMAGAVIAGLAWAHSSLSAMFGGLPLSDVLILLAGLPLAAAAGGWLLAGREPDVISRQPLD